MVRLCLYYQEFAVLENKPQTTMDKHSLYWTNISRRKSKLGKHFRLPE